MEEGTKFSILERYGENFTEKEYITNPAIGRDEQIKQLILILLTPEKSGILVGKPGIGKTAIVEGLSYVIQRGNVPDALKGYTIINIKTASLLGTLPNGESKVQLMIDELKTKEKIILFIDEIHMLIGATSESSVDFANIFKEGLGRGSIKVIGATTTEEYERYILRDKAFTRRFQKVEVPEPTRDETVQILVGTLPKIEKNTGVRMKYSAYQKELIFGFIVDMTSEYKRVYEVGSRYPDIALTLVKSAFSFTVFDNRKEVNIYDFEKAIKNTYLVYPDVIKKELPKFKETFKDIYDEELNPNNHYEIPLSEPTIEVDQTQKFPSYPKSHNFPSNIGNRNVNVEPERVKSEVINNYLINNEVKEQPIDLNLDLNIEEDNNYYMEEDFPESKEDFEGIYIQPTPMMNSFYDKGLKVSNLGMRDMNNKPQKVSHQQIDNIIIGNSEMNPTPLNNNQNSNITSTDLNLDIDNSDDNMNDDFYE